MWPQTGHLPGSQSSQPPLARSYPSVSVIYCQLERDQALEFSPGEKQLEWWHRLCLVCLSQHRYLCCCALLGNMLLEVMLALYNNTSHTSLESEHRHEAMHITARVVYTLVRFTSRYSNLLTRSSTGLSGSYSMQETETIVKRYAAVIAEQDEWGICYALGLKADSEKLPKRSMEPVQCALQLLSSLTQASHEKGCVPIYCPKALFLTTFRVPCTGCCRSVSASFSKGLLHCNCNLSADIHCLLVCCR